MNTKCLNCDRYYEPQADHLYCSPDCRERDRVALAERQRNWPAFAAAYGLAI